MEYSRKDNPLYEYAAAVTPAPEEDDAPPSRYAEAAWMMRTALRVLVSASDGDTTNLYFAVQRAAGMTLAEIGANGGMSKQAVYKRLAAMCRSSSAVAAYLDLPGALDEAIAPGRQATMMLQRDDEEIRRITRKWNTRTSD